MSTSAPRWSAAPAWKPGCSRRRRVPTSSIWAEPMADFVVRTATRPELDILVGWAAKEGWNPGPRDADCFHAADPDGFLIGLLDGEPVTAISAVSYGVSFGFLGFYLCVPEQRGRGDGIKTWEAGMARLEKVRTLGLDGVVAQQ